MKLKAIICLFATFSSISTKALEFIPLVDDWMISEEIGIGGLYQENFDVTSCQDDYLVVWGQFDEDIGSVSIYGVAVDASGGILSDTRFKIGAPQSDGQVGLGIRVASDGRGYLVAWREYLRNDAGYRLMAARVSRAGEVLDPDGIELRRRPYRNLIQPDFDVESNGTHYLICWGERDIEPSIPGDKNSWSVYGVRLNQQGIIEESTPMLLGQPVGVHVSVSKGPAESFRVIAAGAEVITTATVDVAADGSVLRIARDYPADNSLWAALAFDGSQFFAAWTETIDPLSIKGSVLPMQLSEESPPILDIGRDHIFPVQSSISSDGDGFLLVWVEARPATGQRKLLGVRISSEGEIVDTDGIPIAPGFGIRQGRVVNNGSSYLVAMAHEGVKPIITAKLIINPNKYLVLSEPRISGEEGIEFQFNAAPGASFEVQYSDDLQEWKVLETFLNFSGEEMVADPTSGESNARFYRALKLEP